MVEAVAAGEPRHAVGGKPFSADDVAYSLNTLNELGGKVKWGEDVREVLDSATAVDPNTTLIKFKVGRRHRTRRKPR